MISGVAPTLLILRFGILVTWLILDFLLHSRSLRLRIDSHITNNLHDIGAVGIVIAKSFTSFFVNDEVITSLGDSASVSGLTSVLNQRSLGVSQMSGLTGLAGKRIREGFCSHSTSVGCQFFSNLGSGLVCIRSETRPVVQCGFTSFADTGSPLNVAEGTRGNTTLFILAFLQVTLEHLISVESVFIVLLIYRDGVAPGCHCHGGGGTGETGDCHRCGGCHSYEALKNLVHVSSFS